MSPLVWSLAAFSLAVSSASRPSGAPSSALAQTDPATPRPIYFPRLDLALPTSLVLEGQVGGATWAVAARGDTAYVGVGPRIIAYDLRPTDQGDAPIELATSAVLGRSVRDLLVDGDRLYAALGDAGIAQFDIADPARIVTRVAHERDMVAGSLSLDGGRLYVALINGGVAVFDAAQPSLPELGRWMLPEPCGYLQQVFDVAPYGQLAYAAVDEHGLMILDVANPAHISAVVENGPGDAWRVAVVGQTAWVAQDVGTVQVYDLRDPLRPRWIARPIERPESGDAVVTSFAVDGDRIAISGQSLAIWDVADPFVPRRLRARTEGVFARHCNECGDGVAFGGGRVVVAGGGSGALTVVGRADSGTPRVVKSAPGMDNGWRSPLIGAPDGRTLYSFENRFDVGLPSDPRVAGPNPMKPTTPGNGGMDSWPESVVVDGRMAYSVAYPYDAQLVAYDLTDASAPKRAGVVDDRAADRETGGMLPDRGWRATSVAKAGDRIVLAGYGSFAVVDAADPAAMRLLAVRGVRLNDALHAFKPSPARDYRSLDLTEDGRIAVGVDVGQRDDQEIMYGGGIQAIDLADPASPRFGPHLETPNMRQHDVAIHGRHAFVAAGKGGLRVYDIADVEAVREIGVWDEGDEDAVAIEMAWPQALLARSHRLELFDVRDPLQPTRVASVGVPGVVKALRLYGGRAWLLMEDAGLVGYDFR